MLVHIGFEIVHWRYVCTPGCTRFPLTADLDLVVPPGWSVPLKNDNWLVQDLQLKCTSPPTVETNSPSATSTLVLPSHSKSHTNQTWLLDSLQLRHPVDLGVSRISITKPPNQPTFQYQPLPITVPFRFVLDHQSQPRATVPRSAGERVGTRDSR